MDQGLSLTLLKGRHDSTAAQPRSYKAPVRQIQGSFSGHTKKNIPHQCFA